jgi:hypothetical protein
MRAQGVTRPPEFDPASSERSMRLQSRRQAIFDDRRHYQLNRFRFQPRHPQ